MFINLGAVSSRRGNLLPPLTFSLFSLLILLFVSLTVTPTNASSSTNSHKDLDYNDREYMSFTSKILSDKELPKKKGPSRKGGKSMSTKPKILLHPRTLKAPPKKSRVHKPPQSSQRSSNWLMKDPGPTVDRAIRRLSSKKPSSVAQGRSVVTSPSKKPTVLLNPTSSPSKKPTVVLKPTSSPSKKPTVVLKPTSSPSKKPTVLLEPTSSKSNNTSTKTKVKNQVRVVIFPESAPVNPDAPGWFALKTNHQYGKELKLGVLLRKKLPSGISADLFDDLDGLDGDASDNLSRLNKKYDKSCRWLEYIGKKEAIPAPVISEQIREMIQGQNRLLSEFFLDLTFNAKPDDLLTHPLTQGNAPANGFTLLDMTKKIFHEQICKDREYDEDSAATKYTPENDKLLPRNFLNVVFLLFLKLHTLTSSTETRDYLDPSELTWIQNYLTECRQADPAKSKKILWYPDECNERVLAFDQDSNFACTPYPEFDFNIKKHDPLLDAVWHMITAVQAHCFESFQPNIRMWHRYALAMADLFPPTMRLRWSASSEDNSKFYRKLFGPNYHIYFDNMNRCLYASTLRSNVPYLVPRFEGHRRTKYAPKQYHKIN